MEIALNLEPGWFDKQDADAAATLAGHDSRTAEIAESLKLKTVLLALQYEKLAPSRRQIIDQLIAEWSPKNSENGHD